MLTTSSSDNRNLPFRGLPPSFSLSPLTNAPLQLVAHRTSCSRMPKVGSIRDPRMRGAGDYRPGQQPDSAGRVTAADSWVSPSGVLDRNREAGREVVVITSVVKRSQVNEGIDEPS